MNAVSRLAAHTFTTGRRLIRVFRDSLAAVLTMSPAPITSEDVGLGDLISNRDRTPAPDTEERFK